MPANGGRFSILLWWWGKSRRDFGFFCLCVACYVAFGTCGMSGSSCRKGDSCQGGICVFDVVERVFDLVGSAGTNVNSCHGIKCMILCSGRNLRFSWGNSRKRKFVPENKMHHITEWQGFAISKTQSKQTQIRATFIKVPYYVVLET